MRAVEIIQPNLYGVEIKQGKVEIPKTHRFSVFLIVDKISDKEYIRQQVMELLLAGCYYIYICGEYSEIWLESIEIVRKQLRKNVDIFKCETIEEFEQNLYNKTSLRMIVPYIVLLIYDNEKIYREIVSRIKCKQK